MNKVEGTVNLSISELDNLRSKISSLEQEKTDLLKHSKEVSIKLKIEEKYTSYKQVDDYSSFSSIGSYRSRYGIPQKLIHEDQYRIIEENTSYMGLEEVISDLRKKEENKVIEKLGSLERQILSLKEKEQNLITKQSEEISQLHKKYKEEDDKTFKINQDHISNLKNQIAALEGKEVDYTKDQIIYKLQQEIETLKMKKSFWSFLN